MFRVKFPVYDTLMTAGWTTYRIRKEKKLGESVLQAIRKENRIEGMKTLDTLCGMLGMQPGDIIEYVPDDEP